MARKYNYSISFTSEIQKLQSRLTTGKTLSGKISDIIARYDHIIRGDMPDFTDSEIIAISNVLSGTVIEPVTVEYLHDELTNADLPDLAAKINQLSIGERYALIEKLGL